MAPEGMYRSDSIYTDAVAVCDVDTEAQTESVHVAFQNASAHESDKKFEEWRH